MNFSRVKFFEIIYDIFSIWSNFIKIFCNWQCFIFIIVTFVFNAIVTPEIIYSYWFIIISSSSFKKFLVSLSIISLIALFSFSSLRWFLIPLIVVSIVSYLWYWFLLFSIWKVFLHVGLCFLLQDLDFPLLYVVKKLIVFKKVKVCYTHKKAFWNVSNFKQYRNFMNYASQNEVDLHHFYVFYNLFTYITMS